MLRFIIAAIACVAALFTVTPTPAEAQPIHYNHYFAIDGPSDIYGMRNFAMKVDRQLPHVKVYLGKHPCRWHKNARCIHVRKVYIPHATWTGRYQYISGRGDTIKLNLWWLNSRRYDHYADRVTAAHEFGHALGLGHSAHGLMHSPAFHTPVRLSYSQLSYLRRIY